ncbi:hypothetical protein GCM10022287_07290 [Gryllotalpicola koreensis]|uniref:DUF222 domain-containing protein n=1 Tax=Gryllotalpicola koreensis TaxID=993086 RepID=A0ABP7ZTQ2_9MICO
MVHDATHLWCALRSEDTDVDRAGERLLRQGHAEQLRGRDVAEVFADAESDGIVRAALRVRALADGRTHAAVRGREIASAQAARRDACCNAVLHGERMPDELRGQW